MGVYHAIDELVVVVAVDDHGAGEGDCVHVDDLDLAEQKVGAVTSNSLYDFISVQHIYLQILSPAN